MPDFIGLFLCLKKHELEQKVWEVWLARYPFMTEDAFVSYEEMLNATRQGGTQPKDIVHGNYVDQVFF